tara:strand:+ start:1771 stop:2016 length:246 start_codon:yes stop_codon:yes gene_type:complete
MDLATRKYRLLEKLMKIGSDEQLLKVERFFKNEISSDENVWDNLPENAKALLKKSQQQSADEEVHSHDMVMEKIRDKYKLP